MTRLQLILACVLSAAMAASASAQSYPYAGAGMPPGMMQGAPMSPDSQMYQGTYPPAAQFHAAMPAPPPVKLPPGVKSENGLLFYNGKAYGDVGAQSAAQFNPYGNQQAAYQQTAYEQNAYQQAAYQQAAYQQAAYQQAAYQQALMPPGSQSSVMSQGMGPQQGEMMGGDGQCSNGQCNGDAGCSDCQDGPCGSCFHHWFGGFWGLPGKLGYCWTAGADALAMTRNTGVSKPLVLDVTTGATLFNANQWNFDMESGVRAFIGLTGPSGIQYQAVYMDVPRMGDSTIIGSPNNLQIPFPLAADTIDFFGADQMVVRYDSRFQSAEANMIFPWGNFQFLAGYRWARLSETSTIQAFDFDDGDISDYTVNSANNLNGGQVGILGQWEFMGHINFDFFAKTGVFCNTSSEHQTLFDFGNSVLVRDASGSRTDVAFLSEIAAQVVVPLGSVFSIQGGYRVLFLNQMATAPQQFDFTDDTDSGTHVNSSNNIIMHGANLGLTAHW